MGQLTNKKVNQALDSLVNRNGYLVTQANDLAKSFGNLTAFEHKVLDFCFSYVKKDDQPSQTYNLNILDIIHQYKLGASGASYKRVARALRALNNKTAIYMRIKKADHIGIMMTSLFDHISILDNGKVEFSFSHAIAPYVFQLKENYYSFNLWELAQVKSKYTLSLMKLWNARSYGKMQPVYIEGDLDDWESWLLGSDEDGEPKHWPVSRFKQQVLNRAISELMRLYPKTMINLITVKNGRRVVGYRLQIIPFQTNLRV